MGFEHTEISSEFENTVAGYLNRDIRFLVFDVIEASEDKQSIKPLIYRFKSDFLYYPLEITATSDAGLSRSEVNIFLLAKGIIKGDVVEDINLLSRTGFYYNIELSEEELKEISPEIADLFSSAYIMNAYYYGSLNRLNKDLVVYKQDVHIPTFFDKISQTISGSLVFQFVSEARKDITEDVPILEKVLLVYIVEYDYFFVYLNCRKLCFLHPKKCSISLVCGSIMITIDFPFKTEVACLLLQRKLCFI